MTGFFLLLIVLAIVVAAVIFVKIDNAANAPDPFRTPEYLELQATLFSIKEIAQNYRDVNPIFSDVVLSEINKHERKELNG